MRSFAKLTALSCAVTVAGSVAGSVQAQEIGVAASVENTIQATAPGQAQRNLRGGGTVVAEDKLRTGANARGQLLFLDETTLSVAPSSEIILDRFVYDPNGGSSGFGLKLTTGALRFVGGATSEAQEAVISTPTATLGIRGSTALVSVANGHTIAVFLSGDRMCIDAGAGRSCTSRQGGVLSQDGYAGQVTSEFVARLLSQIDGAAPGQLVSTGGRSSAGVVDATSPRRAPVSSRGRNMGAADLDAFTRADRNRNSDEFFDSFEE